MTEWTVQVSDVATLYLYPLVVSCSFAFTFTNVCDQSSGRLRAITGVSASFARSRLVSAIHGGAFDRPTSFVQFDNPIA
jgi:hypothetical protein